MTLLTQDLLNKYLKDGKRNAAYTPAINKDEKNIIDLYDELRVHANGEIPTKLIHNRRPNEPLEIQEYRKMLYEAITKETVSRILTCLTKIRRSADWSVRFDPKTVPNAIAPQESPEEYFDKRYPNFTSLTNWLFSVCLKNYLIDANAICMVVPLNTVEKENEYLKPFPYIFNSDQVLEYQEEDFMIILSKDKSTYRGTDGRTVYHDGKIFWVVNVEKIIKYVQVNTKGDLKAEIDFVHGLGYMPAFKLGGVFLRAIENTFIYESRIQPIVPRLNKAVREDNDLDVSVVRHLFPEKWEYVTLDCPKCKGIGKIAVKNGSPIDCGHCKGVGKVVGSPFQSHLLTPTSIDKQAIPAPPAGYIAKDVEIIKHMEERVERHIDKALAAINMEFLSKTPLNESGTAKEVDKDELNNFVHSIAEDLVKVMDEIFMISYDYRYSFVIPNEEKRKAMLPEVNVPEKFDMLSVNYLLQEYQSAKTAKMNPVIIAQMELEIASKKFNVDPEVKDELTTILKLDPFAGMASDDKLTASSNGWITTEDCIISSNIVGFVRRAVFEDPKFYSLPVDEQKEIVKKFAEEMKAEMSAAGKVLKMAVVDEENSEDDADRTAANN